MKYKYALSSLFLSLLLLTGMAEQNLAQSSAAFPGGFSYVFNTVLNEVFDISPDGRRAVVGTLSETSPFGRAQVAIVDTVTGARLDTKVVGNGSPIAVKLAPLNDALRAVVLSNDFGNLHITIYDVAESGLMTFRSDAQLNNDPGLSVAGSNICISPATRTGFVSVLASGIRLVSFSLDTGSVLHSFPTPVSQFLNIYENSTRRILVSGSTRQVVFVDYTNPSSMQELGRVMLPSSESSFGTHDISTAFSLDGQYLFAGSGFALLSAINTSTRQIVGSVNNPRYRARQLKIFESGNTRFLVMRGLEDGNNALKGFALVNAADPSNLSVVNELVLGEQIFSNRDFAIARDGRYIFVGSGGGGSGPTGKLTAYSLPSFAQSWQLSFPAVSDPVRIATFMYGTRERIYAAFNGSPGRIYSFPVLSNPIANFDEDFKTDIGVFRPETAQWLLLPSTGSIPSGVQFGQPGDVPVPADYDGDGKTDFATFRPSEGRWLIGSSSGGETRNIHFGVGSDTPVPADYDGDGKADLALVRKNPHRWLILQSSNGQLRTQKFGYGIIKPVVGDYDADGKADLAYFSSGRWQILTSTGALVSDQFGQAGDTPISGDFDFDGKTDIAVFERTTATWRIKQSFAGLRESQFGQNLDLPVPADYDGDGKTDLATFRPSDATWRILQSSNNTTRTVVFGAGTDIPLTLQK